MIRAALNQGYDETARRRAGELGLLATRGVSAVEPYVTRYLPALVVAAVLPVLTVIAILSQDWLSAIVVICTLPLIPVFAALIGLATQEKSDQQWRTLSVLSGHFLDVVRGLPTLVAYRRAGAQLAGLADHRRLPSYDPDVEGGLPLLGRPGVDCHHFSGSGCSDGRPATGPRHSRFPHRSGRPADGSGGLFGRYAVWVQSSMRLPKAPPPSPKSTNSYRLPRRIPRHQTAPTWCVADRPPPRRVRRREVLHDVTATIPERGLTAIVGPSGCGKSTLLAALLGELPVQQGTITVGGVPILRPPCPMASPGRPRGPASLADQRDDCRQRADC